MYLVCGKCNLIVSSCVTSVMPKYHKGGFTLQWRHNECDGISNHQPRDCLRNRLFRYKWKKTKLRVTGLCAGNLPVTVEFPAQRARNAEMYPFDDVIMQQRADNQVLSHGDIKPGDYRFYWSVYMILGSILTKYIWNVESSVCRGPFDNMGYLLSKHR